jgi:hypothetical protein
MRQLDQNDLEAGGLVPIARLGRGLCGEAFRLVVVSQNQRPRSAGGSGRSP